MSHVSNTWCNNATFYLSKCKFNLGQKGESGIAMEETHIEKGPQQIGLRW